MLNSSQITIRTFPQITPQNVQNKPKYVWCTLVMLNDIYAAGAVVMAKSLRNVNTKYPIHCMVTDDVSTECKKFLKLHFDHLIEVPTISHPCVKLKHKRQQSEYGSWIGSSFTKLNVFKERLFPYEKVMFLDADMIFTKNCDHLFELETPALTFSTPWCVPYGQIAADNGRANACARYGMIDNPYYRTYTVDNKIGDIRRELNHGEAVNRYSLAIGLRNSIVGLTNMFLVTPDNSIYNTAMKILFASELYGNSDCESLFDEQLIAETLLKLDITPRNIHQKYNCLVGKENIWLLDGDSAHVHQFYNQKPWDVVKVPFDRNGDLWSDITDWWSLADTIITKYNGHWFYQGMNSYEQITTVTNCYYDNDDYECINDYNDINYNIINVKY